MSVPASEIGSVGSAVNTAAVAQPTAAATPATGTSIPSSWIGGLITSAFSGSSFLPNAGLAVFGAILILGALLISQKSTIVQLQPAAEALVG
jgi:hypothetical protein